MNWIKDYPHRSSRTCSNTITENTEKATRAIKENVALNSMFNFTDGTPVVFHDHNLNRLLGNALISLK